MIGCVDRSFEEIQVGDQASFEVVVSERELVQFAELTGDYNPLHVTLKEDNIPQTNDSHVSHGMFLASYFSRLIGMYLPGRQALYLSQELKFLRFVRAKEQITIKGTVVSKSNSSKTIILKTQIYNQSAELVVDGKAEVLVREPIKTEQKIETATALSLSNKVILVTGASRGIGAAIAQVLAENGATVVLNYDQDTEGANKTLNQIKAEQGRAVAIKADISDPEQVTSMMEKIKKEIGLIDILVNNAAPPFRPLSFTSLDWDQIDRQLSVILKGAFYCAKAVVPSMIQKREGKIINILTTYAVTAPPTQLTHYVVAKSALAGLSRSLAIELGPMGIQVNMVAPGMTETSLIDHVPPRFRDFYASQAPLKRLGKPSDVAKVVLFLCSDLSDFMTGATLPVCGGVWMT